MKPLKTRWAFTLTTLAIFVITSGLGLAETLYITSKSAKVRAGKTSLDAITDTVHYGDTVESIRQENEWFEVKTKNGAQGWVHTTKLSNSPPTKGQDSTFLGMPLASRASQPTVSAGARGLDKVAEGYAEGSGISPQSRAAVDKMTSYQVDDKRVETFLKEGGLGDYAK
ncbi:MAG: SH3 domain-containing protein [Nitrospira sp.]|nr:SH3 domain-containing protein [Nitrospira sp.]